MKRTTATLVSAWILCWLTGSAFGANNIEVRLNGGEDIVRRNAVNTLDIWIENDEPLKGIQIGFEIEYTAGCDITWNLGYGSAEGNMWGIHESWNVVGAWSDNDSFKRLNDELSDIVTIHTFITAPGYFGLQASKKRLCYSLEFYASSAADDQSLSVKPISFPDDGMCHWKFWTMSSATFAPLFHGVQLGSMCDPSPESREFPVLEPSPAPHICGDVNGSGAIDQDDTTFLVEYIFSGGPPPCSYWYWDLL
jgi:hypothetical protein